MCGDPGIPWLGSSAAAGHLRAVASALLSLGYRVTAAVARLEPPAGSLRAGGIEGVDLLHIPLGNGFYPLRRWPELREIRHGRPLARAAGRHLAADPPALVYERMSLYCDAGRRLARRFGCPHLLEINAPLAAERTRFQRASWPGLARRWERRIARDADRCVAISSPLAAHLEALGVAPERIRVEANGVDLQRFRPRPADLPLGSAPGLASAPRRGPVLVFAGGFRPWHGLEALVPLMKGLIRRLPESRLLLIGDGPARAGLAAAFQAAGLAAAVAWVGPVPQAELPALLSLADAAVIPPPPAGFDYFCPLKVLEAMAMGLPVLGHGRGDVPALLGLGSEAAAGAALPWDAGEEAAAVILGLWEDGERWRALGAAGLRRASRQGWDAVVGRILSWALAGSPAPSPAGR